MPVTKKNLSKKANYMRNYMRKYNKKKKQENIFWNNVINGFKKFLESPFKDN
jgi:hypothetical protein